MDAKPIVLGGKAYRSVEEMPPEVRENTSWQCACWATRMKTISFIQLNL
jgi:hypothetical protein